ncbi:Carboxylesterase NlhH [Thalassoglobus neptunius]|uniref:Carboxylesterase NlhH n=1 Tax=Thalassoglobus neptunius TaxID=1938619 RepID=A0A5C5X7I0_9PLAN|nr:alpha/beta hydrolase [Thalassoglobus neptunius]TWT58075.1 Carboxylesterase NlhH [Thalassoglobus neptunius]
MTRTLSFYTIAIVIHLSGALAFAQNEVASMSNISAESLDRANRLMERIDSDGNGTFEKSENERTWRRYAKLDVNRDEVLSVEELAAAPVRSLDTKGEKKLNVVYKTIGNRKLLLDLYYPETHNNKEENVFPLIVYTHGGGWAAGSKEGIANGSFRVVFERLLDHGFAVASVGYRLCRANSGVTMRDCIIDSKDAVRYLAKNSAALQLDPSNVFVMGDSAGGQIAQLLLLSSPESLPGSPDLKETSYRMVAGVSWYGPSDFERIDLFNHDDRPDFHDRFGARILGNNSDPSDKNRLYREMSPVAYLKPVSPPLLMIQGDKDTTIPVKHAYHMKKKADELDAPVEIMIIQNSGHNWRKVDAEISPTREEIIDRTVQFFVDHRMKEENK